MIETRLVENGKTAINRVIFCYRRLGYTQAHGMFNEFFCFTFLTTFTIVNLKELHNEDFL